MVNIRPLSVALSKKAQEELNERPERIQEDLNALRQWIAKAAHLRCRIDDQFLVAFLRGCKYSLERAKEKLDMFYTVRTMSPELIRTRDPEDPRTRAIIRLGVGLALPNTEAADSPRIILVRPAAYDPAQFTISEIIRVSTMINDLMMMEDDNFVVAGQIGILDLANVTMAHFLQFTPSFVKKMTLMSQEASPLRQKGFHYINTPHGFEVVFNMFKNFMSEKNKSRLYVHGQDLESLYRHVPKRLLPAEYGGEAGPIQDIINQTEKKFLAFREYFLEEDKYGTDEKKRPGRPKDAESLFGVEGSFRQLQVD
ncbi:alpha-tocopherol transfer protein-like [Sabethes cyaneus]|uniref:alpha-tocopherol transfer protein-like n=1 Tax=Sabethes cyaneus TaxID=53552 RepID=UPI00237E4FAF|nr:alpha-tocopherol transfer protein-like [Sabethes cyaneus]